MSNREHQSQVETWLGRSLTPEELLSAESLEKLSQVQLAVVKEIAPRDAFSAMLYLRIIVANVLVRDLKPFVDDIMIASQNAKLQDLPNLPLFERYLGRPLEPVEKTQVTRIEDLSSAHLAVASFLLRAEPPVGYIYLQRIVPAVAPEEQSKLAAALTANEQRR